METIIIKSTDSKKTKALLDYLKKNRIKAELYQEPDKKQILKNIEKGAKEVADHIRGKKKLRDVKELLREL